ncbi:MAG: branched-chain amino acid ABC transporter substrate-binding protein [Syntrophobacteraceae bacterium]
MKKLALVPVTLALALACGNALASDPTLKGPIKIGLMAPITGSYASEGQEMKQVLDLLAEELNAKGGIQGQKVEVLTQDDGSEAKTSALAAQRLVTQGVVAVVGTYGSSVTEPSQSIFNESKIPQIANGSTAVRLTEKGLKYFFRTCPRDDEQGKVAAQTIQKLGVKKLAILHDNSTYAKGLADETKALLKDVAVVFFDALTPKEQDYTTILTKLKAAQPEFVFFTGYYGEAGLLLKQKKDMGWNVPFMGGDATNNPDLVKIAGKDAANGFYFLTPPLPKDLPNEEARSLVVSFTKKYGTAPSSIYSLLAGDGFRVLAEAIDKTKSSDPDKLNDYLKKTLKDFPGLTGKIAFNDKGDRVGEVYRVYKVNEEGQFILQP